MPRRRTRSRKCGHSPAKPMRPIRTGRWSPPRARKVSHDMASRARGFRSTLRAAITFATVALAGCMHMQPPPPSAPTLRLSQVPFTMLSGWAEGDLQPAVTGFRRSCAVLALKADNATLGGLYAGTAGDWRAACAAASNATSAREFFETNFTPYRVSQASEQGLFTG